jgi:hypothetical protein
MQEGRQIRRRNSVGDLREGYQKTTKPPVQRKNVTDKVIDALTSTDVLDKIMPVLTQKITGTLILWNLRLVLLEYCSWFSTLISSSEILLNRALISARLSQLKFHRQIYTYWTSDGRIYVKKLETSRKQLVTNFDDIENIEVGVHTVSGPIRQKSHNDL